MAVIVKMLRLLLPVLFTVATASVENPAGEQLQRFKLRTKHPIGVLTTETGAPVEYRDATNSLNTELLDNENLIDMYDRTLRQTIPERIVHAPGAGAFGYFIVTHDITDICKAKLFSEIGKRTPVAMRFSIGFSSIGVRDTIRESRGFAVKFYTEDGNYDLTTLDLPIFAIKEPLIFPSITHVLKRNPKTNLPDHNMIWDFITLHPEALNQFIRIFSQHGMPDGYRNIRGYGIHTNQVYNETGSSHYVRFYVFPKGGARFLNASQTSALASEDPNLFAKNLYNDIESGDYPTWNLLVQVIPEEDARNPELGIFDVTMEQSFDKYPLRFVGDIILNRNPDNYFAQIEQIAFSPGNYVPGMLGSPDKIFQSRRFAYRESANHRLGVNFKQIPVNCPITGKAHTYSRDGAPPINENGGGSPNYFPNTFNGPVPYVEKNRPAPIKIHEISKPTNLHQVVDFWKSLTSVEQNELVDNLVEHVGSCQEDIQERVIEMLTKIHAPLGKKLAEGLAAESSD